LGAKMSLSLKRLSLAKSRVEMLTRTEADLHAQYLELAELRERVREAQLSAAGLPTVTRAFEPVSDVIAATV
jgi:hypothetical protein